MVALWIPSYKLEICPPASSGGVFSVKKNLLSSAWGLVRKCPPPTILDLLSTYCRFPLDRVNLVNRTPFSLSVSDSLLLTS